MRLRSKVFCVLFSLFSVHFSLAQEGSADWSVSLGEPDAQGVREAVFEAAITPSWHLYDMGPYEIPGLATSFDFSASEGVELVGAAYELGSPVHRMDETFGFETGYYEGTARFGQKLRAAQGAVIAGEIEYQICRDEVGCIRGVWDFSQESGVKSQESGVKSQESGVKSQESGVERVSRSRLITPDSSLLTLILEAVLWGFAALLTPCVFPMVPMTVSFFLKDRISRLKAVIFGVFIVALYTLPIAAIILTTYFAGGEAVTADIFNWLATHWIPNVLFFVVFMIFAASLLGAFELRLPSSWLNKSDRGAERGGLIGVFFLALTLVLVSFSCTGPIVGTVLIKSTQGEFWAPILTMMVFSAAFALPFTLLALFPGLMDRMPRSGGWLGGVKVLLGLAEVALGLKFLSVADQTYHWGILPREVYLAIWIVVFAVMGFYLLGKIRFKHDAPVETIGVGRLFGAMAVFSFVVWLVPGMWGAPLSAISGYLPPISSQEFRGGGQTAASETPAVKYSDILTLPHGLTGYFDFEQGLAAARAEGKPVFLDFTGHGCVNCREMEARVWVDSRVLEILRQKYIVLALYSDDRTQLPDSEWVTTAAGKVLKTMGRVNSYLINTRYGVSAQPAYLILNGAGELLKPVYGYDLSVEKFIEFLQ